MEQPLYRPIAVGLLHLLDRGLPHGGIAAPPALRVVGDMQCCIPLPYGGQGECLRGRHLSYAWHVRHRGVQRVFFRC